MDMEKLHEFANILTRKEEDFETKVEQAANAFSEMDEKFETKIEQAANAFSKMDENLETKNEQAANAFSEMDEKLGTKIEPKYDPQKIASSDHRPTMYIYMITKNEVFFAVHLYNPNKFTKKVADHYYKIELSNGDDNKYKFYTYKTLQADSEYKRLIQQEPVKKEYFIKSNLY